IKLANQNKEEVEKMVEKEAVEKEWSKWLRKRWWRWSGQRGGEGQGSSIFIYMVNNRSNCQIATSRRLRKWLRKRWWRWSGQRWRRRWARKRLRKWSRKRWWRTMRWRREKWRLGKKERWKKTLRNFLQKVATKIGKALNLIAWLVGTSRPISIYLPTRIR